MTPKKMIRAARIDLDRADATLAQDNPGAAATGVRLASGWALMAEELRIEPPKTRWEAQERRDQIDRIRTRAANLEAAFGRGTQPAPARHWLERWGYAPAAPAEPEEVRALLEAAHGLIQFMEQEKGG